MATLEATDLVRLTLNTIRGLTMDAVQAANSGHPGMPMGAAGMGYALFARHLRFDPESPQWFNRDRFILSAGHGSLLLYSLLHLTGYDLSLEDIKSFRQWGSRTPGHPECDPERGIEVTTGPLGQGFGMAVGMAIAEERLRSEFPELVDHRTYVICSDGDLMEGVSSEAASLAGHLRLGRLVCLYDSNRITIDGGTDLTFSEDVAKRFEALDWHVSRCNGLEVDNVDAAVVAAKAETERPSLIICDTVIAEGSPNKAGTAASHGAALGEEEVRLAKRNLGIPEEPAFYVPHEVLRHMREVGCRHRAEREASEAALSNNPELLRRVEGRLPDDWGKDLPSFNEAMATRAASGAVLNTIADRLPELIGGSADLTGSNQTALKSFPLFSSESRGGRNIHFGVREHAMACAINGMNVHGGVRAYGGTFLIFSDYMRPAIRIAALMKAPSVFVFTHDSIGLGEDGPTHQPIEHLASLRAMPNLRVIRPADANETVAAWKAALEYEGPTALILTRQKVPVVTPPGHSALLGAYVLSDPDFNSLNTPRVEGVDPASPPEAILIGTGSEVQICLDAQRLLSKQGVSARVVSMPCWELFAEQSDEYRNEVLPPGVGNRVSVEAAATLGWERWIGDRGHAIGIDRFGASAPFQDIYRNYGLTPERVADAVLNARP
ncbi:MAG: transketolase [Armatimonadetes bacterium]|nr:transketolase [Armatimonadota bacterium]